MKQWAPLWMLFLAAGGMLWAQSAPEEENAAIDNTPTGS